MAPAQRFTTEQQEELILNAAITAIEETSLLGFKMSDIAKYAGMSMGSVYKHVQSKEDVLLALATANLKQTQKHFAAIYQLELTTPERYIAMILTDKSKANLFPFASHLEMLITNDAILSRCSEAWKHRFHSADTNVDAQCSAYINQALATKELRIPNGEQDYANKFSLGLWAISVGFIHVSNQLRGKHLFGHITPDSELLDHTSLQIQTIKNYINAYDWQSPLTDEGIHRAISALKTLDLR
ncbi:TetR/AcrR family transcriptional regulator [Paraglaciecola aquimarina]|uniref:TetR/AcrR family transcriptional regulator n=1 Tax=Paraglaciecola algarum TaxID=3050085 RepID=A0ABS9D5U7_9ALTE|nr:TetR/AcrR family transcriptional regulator [Paraglaciecola sp. G1-23]MCF2948246.1 TetR/AcrR family transcriptional regulator [Paraglaciecola sp. G1-23]